MATLSHSTHPLLDAIHAEDRLAHGALRIAGELKAAHRAKGVSDATVFAVDPDGTWSMVGPSEWHRDLLGQVGYVEVASRAQSPRDIAVAVSAAIGGQPAKAGPSALHRLADMAEALAPLAEVLLAVAVSSGALEWDTPETIHEAARRLSLDAAWSARRDPNVRQPGDLWTQLLSLLGYEQHSASEYAQRYLSDRPAIDAALDEAGIVWGAPLLSANDAAARCSVTSSTWRAYVARIEAPSADEERGWRVATIDAWRLGRRDTSWWQS